MTQILVADSGPLISLAGLQLLELPFALGHQLMVPNAVFAEATLSGKPMAQEIAAAHARGQFSVIDDPQPDHWPEAPWAGLGEAAAIRLAISLGCRLLIDERRARALAKRLGLSVIGTLGILAMGRERGLLKDLAPLIQRLVDQGYWLSPLLVGRFLAAYGETLSQSTVTLLESRRRTD